MELRHWEESASKGRTKAPVQLEGDRRGKGKETAGAGRRRAPMIWGIEQQHSAEESTGEGHRYSLAECGGKHQESAEVSASAAKLSMTGSTHESVGKGQKELAHRKSRSGVPWSRIGEPWRNAGKSTGAVWRRALSYQADSAQVAF